LKENPEVAAKISTAIRDNSVTVADSMIGTAEASAAE
jgi:hypothetical protein